MSFYINIIALPFLLIAIWLGNKQKHKTIYRVRIISVSLIMFCLFNICFEYIDFIELKNNENFIDQMINVSGVFVGFIFAGISILFSLIGLNKLESEFKNDFLDKVFHKSFLCIMSSLVVLVTYFVLNIGLLTKNFMYKIIIYAFAFSIFYLLWCLIDYFKLIFESKKNK